MDSVIPPPPPAFSDEQFIVMPPAFPETEFRAFGRSATKFFFPVRTSEESVFAPREEERRHFEGEWQAVRYRYRSCAECQDEFKALLTNAKEWLWAGFPDEELNYRLERSIYMFFMSALSVFDSFVFSLYLVGHAIQPGAFPDVAKPRNITRKATAKAYKAAFPPAKITSLLTALPHDAGFRTIDAVRNRVGHRTSGKRIITESSATHADTTRSEWREQTWALPSPAGNLLFDAELHRRESLHIETIDAVKNLEECLHHLGSLPIIDAAVTNDLKRRIISVRRSIDASSKTHTDGTRTEWRAETEDLPRKLTFDEEMLQRHLDAITRLLTALVSAALEFAQSHHPAHSAA